MRPEKPSKAPPENGWRRQRRGGHRADHDRCRAGGRLHRERVIRIESAFPAEVAAECRGIIWRDLGTDPGDPATWPRTVAARPDHPQPPFVAAANTPRSMPSSAGTLDAPHQPRRVVIRFPGGEPAVVDGRHVDVSFPGPGSTQDDYMTWRANVASLDRALLMFFLLSDVGPDDGPTRLRPGSHLDVARVLEPEREHGSPGGRTPPPRTG